MTENVLSKIIPIALATILTGAYSNTVQAQSSTGELLQQIEQYSQSDRQNNIEQVTNVNQLRDVSPTDWSYDALRSLRDRYGCISGFPDGTYKGNQPITRYEFAAGLNSCFQQIERLNNSSSASPDDSLESIRYRNYNPEPESATFSGRIDELESRTILLGENQFSPTTKMDADATLEVNSVNSD